MTRLIREEIADMSRTEQHIWCLIIGFQVGFIGVFAYLLDATL